MAFVAIAFIASLLPAVAVMGASEFPVRVAFEFRAKAARAQFKDADIPARERDVSEKLRQACQTRLKYWTFVPTDAAAITSTPPSAKQPVLRIWLEESPMLGDVRILMKLEGPTMEARETLPWTATLFTQGELDSQGFPGGETLKENIFNKFQYSDEDPETLLRRNESDVRARLQAYVPIAVGDNYKYLGPKPLQKSREAMAMLPLARDECRELVRSEFRIRYLRQGTPPAEVAALTRGVAGDAAGVKVMLTQWEEQPGKVENVDETTLSPARMKEIFETFTDLKCRLIYLSKFQPFDILD